MYSNFTEWDVERVALALAGTDDFLGMSPSDEAAYRNDARRALTFLAHATTARVSS